MNRNVPMAIPDLDLFNFEPCNTEVAEVVKTYSEDLDLVFKLEGQLGQLGILRGGLPPGSPNPECISHQRMEIFTPVFTPDL